MRLATTIALVALTTAIAAPGNVSASTGGGGKAQHEAEVKMFKKHLRSSQATINWWNNKGHWALYSNHDHCWELKGKRQRAVCKHARANLEAHAARVARLEALLAPPAPVYGMMNPICQSSCISCESGWNPNAWNGNDYWGLYQFDYGTWVAHGGAPSMYGKADASTQHLVASRITYDAWPNC